MHRVLLALALVLLPITAQAQDRFWVQVEAHPTLAEAMDRARTYARRFERVEGYALGTGFYGIALGPFADRDRASDTLNRLLNTGQIPGDSYLQNGSRFEQRFWPVGAPAPAPQPVTSAAPSPIPLGPPETIAEARASEARLSRQDREDLQRALAWAGYYDAAIDGAFGRGTRAAMERWQIAAAQDPTGVLTTSQRAALLNDYRAVLTELGMERVVDAPTGIAIDLPMAAVALDGYDAPLARFTATGLVEGAQVLLISQAGDRDRLAGLYQVLQILDVIPAEGQRSLGATGFEIEGIDDRIHSTTRVQLREAQIKGYTLVWPAGDDARRLRVLAEMQSSFTMLDGVLDPDITPASAEQSVDRFAGLAVRQPQRTGSGVYISDDGLVLTSDTILDGCARLTIDLDTPAQVALALGDLGVAVLRPEAPMAPLDQAAFHLGVPRLNDPIAVASYPYDGVLSAPSLSFGTVSDLRDLAGDDRRLRLAAQAGGSSIGAPVLNEQGGVMGLLVPSDPGLPADVQFALKADVIADALAAAGVDVASAVQTDPISDVALQRLGTNIAALVRCW